jgi:hypothetical protein
MEERFKTFFKGVGQEVTDYLGEGGNVRFRIGDSTYTLKIDEDRDLEIEKDLKEDCDIEITTEEDIINDIFAATSMAEYRERMAAYTYADRKPRVKILMERKDKEAARFIRTYIYFLRRLWLLN